MRLVPTLARLAALWLILAVGAADRASAEPADDDISALQPSMVDALTSSGLIGRGEPFAAFSWTLETKRPARAPRRVREQFAGTPPGAPAGLSPMVRETLAPTQRPARLGVSVRGLALIQPDDTEPDIGVQGLRMPLEQGARFRLDFEEEGSSLSQDCVAGSLVPGSSVHPAIPGDARTIDCSGRGRYQGIPVRVSARVLYFVSLGVFLDAEQRIETPVGALRSGTRVLSFEMAKR